MFVKPPEKGSPFPMHQDHPFFPHTYHRMAAAIFFLDDAPEEKGCVRVVPGSYKNGPLEHIAEGSFHLPTDDWPIEKSVPVPAQAGDVIFFSYLTVHASGREHLRRGRAPPGWCSSATRPTRRSPTRTPSRWARA